MPGDLLYLDSSALVKLVLPEAETGALIELLGSWPQRLSSDMAIVEVSRSARRASAQPAVLLRASQVLAGLHLLRIDEEILSSAAIREPPGLRSLDAIHLASALSLGPDLGAFVVYDAALGLAAKALGIRVLAPR